MTVGYRKGPVLLWEWIGFRDAGAAANLDTSTAFELLPPAADTGVGEGAFTVHRVVGELGVRHQSGIVSHDPVGIVLTADDVGDDQTVGEPVDPQSTDVDEMASKKIMWWWNGSGMAGAPVADTDIVDYRIPLDIRVKRILDKRTRLVITAQATTTGRMRVSCNVRTLIRRSMGA